MDDESLQRLRDENDDLRLRLAEAEQALEAIRTGQVESLVVETERGLRIFSLEGSAHSYRALVEAMNEGAAKLGEDGTILYCNSRLARMLGAPLERVMGSSLSDFIPAHAQRAFGKLLLRAIDGEAREEVLLLDAGGAELPAYLSINTIEEEGRRVLCTVATDLRAQRRNEEIVAAEAFARSVLEQAADAIVVCNEAGRVIRASRVAAELSGRDPLDLPFDTAFPLALPTAYGGGVAACALAGEVLQAVPSTLSRPDGTAADVLVSAACLRGDSGGVLGCVITIVDVTESRRAERALRESEERLREADRRKDQFLATLSHELRNPLAPIRNSVYILGRVPPGSAQATRAQSIIDRQVAHLTRLVDDLLDATRVARNKVQLKRERLDLRALVRRTVEDHRSLFERTGVRLDLEVCSEPVFVSADPTRLSQILGNLLSNAAKFTGRGGRATVSLSTAPEERLALLSVSDTGAGIAPEMIGRLFDLFVQAESTLDRSQGGLGLGLALVKGLVELHGGDVRAHSEGPGRGADFVVRLPLDTAATVEAEAEAKPAAEHRAPRKRRVLVVEDNIDAAESLKEALEIFGHDVDVAHDGSEGLAKVRAMRPEVVLCDIGLPGMDGYAVARAVRAEPALACVRLVALTGYALPEDRLRAVEAGFDEHLAKPPALDKLEALVDSSPGLDP